MTEKMTSKFRAQLRAQANTLEPLFQVGKGGVSEALIAQTEDALRVHELIKLKVLLESAPDTPRNIAEEIAAKTGSQVVQVIGGAMIFYKENPELRAEQEKKKQKEKELKKKSTGMGAKDFSKKYKSKRTAENSRNTKNARGVKKARK